MKIFGEHEPVPADFDGQRKATRFTDAIGRVWVVSSKDFAGRWWAYCESRRGLHGTFSSHEIKESIIA